MVGRLIYLIGPSGSGKDSLLDAARDTLAQRDCRVVRRVITRSAEAVGEAAQAVTVEQFEQMRERGAFALSWQANGLHYGIPKEIDQWLAQGFDVLINGSRGYLPQARERRKADASEVIAAYRETIERVRDRISRARR